MPTRKWGSEKLVNTTATGNQLHSDVAALAGGGFVVVWEDYSAGPDAAIRGQRYDAAGNPVGGEMLIAPKIEANNLFLPKVTGLADGTFYVSWTQETASENYIFGKVYNANGGFVRDQPVVFADTHVSNGDLAPFGGGAAAVWVDPTGGGDIYLRIFDFTGAGGGLIPVSTYPGGSEGEVIAAASPDGSTVAVAWSSGEGGDTSCPVRLYTAGGVLITTFVDAAPDDVGYVSSPDVCWLNNSQFVVTWRNQTDFIGSNPGDIRLRVFNFNGTTVTATPFSEIVLANATTAGEQQLPVITALPSGGFVVAWLDFSETGPDDADAAIRLQAFDGSGGKIGGEIVVNTMTSGDQLDPSITALRDGRVVVSWTDYSSGLADIRMQIVDPRDGVVTGTSASDTLYGHDLVNDEISGFAGNDLLIGLKGDDGLYGGEGADQLQGGAGADFLDGGAGTDLADYSNSTAAVVVNLTTGAASGGHATGDTFTSIESVLGSAFGDTLTGDSAANTLNGSTGADNMLGLGGNDIYLVDNAGDTVTEAVGGGYDRVAASVSYVLAAGQEIEFFTTNNATSTSAINMTGNEFANSIVGNAGANIINGGGNADLMQGLGGNDLYYVDHAGDVVNEAAGAGSDRVNTSVSYTLAAGQEIEVFTTTNTAGLTAINMTGNEFANSIVGNAGANTLDGKGGVDTMQGLGGNDQYFVDSAADVVIEAAGSGSDRVFTSVSYTLTAGQEIEVFTTTNNAGLTAINLTGNVLNQTIAGNAGSNILNGGAGNDALHGFGGNDSFLFNTALNAATNVDTIADFAVVDDTVLLENAVFTGLAAGTLTANAFRIGAAAADADDRIIYNNATGQLIFDSNGNAAGGATQFATLAAGLALTNADFIVI